MQPPLTQKLQYWSEQLQRVEDSGLSLVEYARQNDIPPAHLYQWRSTLKKLHIPRAIGDEPAHHFTQVVSTVAPSVPLSLQLGHANLQFRSLPEPTWIVSLLEQAHKS